MTTSIYLNNAATAWPLAPGVIDAMAQTMHLIPAESERSSGTESSLATRCRTRLAALLDGADPNRIVITSSATMALNLAILGVTLHRDDLVVATAFDHNSVLRPLRHAARRSGARMEIVRITADGDVDLDHYCELLSHRPRLVAMTHASNVTGYILPARQMLLAARYAGACTLLDASQSLGWTDVSVRQLPADLIALTAHKGLRGPQGVGALYVGPDTELDQVVVGGTGIRSDRVYHPEEMPLRLEAGTPNDPALAGWLAALEWHEHHRTGYRRLVQRHMERLHTELSDVAGVCIYPTPPDAPRTPVISYTITHCPTADVGMLYAEAYGIALRHGLHCAPLVHGHIGRGDGSIRVSPSGDTTDAEIDRLIDATAHIAAAVHTQAMAAR